MGGPGAAAALLNWGKHSMAWVEPFTGAGAEPDEAGHTTVFISVTGCKPQLLTCKQQ